MRASDSGISATVNAHHRLASRSRATSFARSVINYWLFRLLPSLRCTHRNARKPSRLNRAYWLTAEGFHRSPSAACPDVAIETRIGSIPSTDRRSRCCPLSRFHNAAPTSGSPTYGRASVYSGWKPVLPSTLPGTPSALTSAGRPVSPAQCPQAGSRRVSAAGEDSLDGDFFEDPHIGLRSL